MPADRTNDAATVQGQGQFDFDDATGQRRRHNTRATRRRNIETLEIPRRPAGYPGKRCSPAACRAVLLCLDDHQREGEAWRIKAETIATKTGYRDRGTIQRAITYLQELGLLSTTRTGRSSVLTIEHAAIADALATAERLADQPAPPSEKAPPSDEACAHIRRGKRPHQMRPAPPSTLPEVLPAIKPPPLEAGGGGFCETWEDIGQALDAAGVFAGTRRQLLAELPRRIDHATAAAVVDHWRQHAGGTAAAAWGAGALVARLREQTPEMSPAAGWPACSSDWLRHKNAEQRRARQAQEAQQQAQQHAGAIEAEQRERERTEALEAAHGPTLAAMDADQTRALAFEALGSFLAARWLANPRQEQLYFKILQHLAANCIDKDAARDYAEQRSSEV